VKREKARLVAAGEWKGGICRGRCLGGCEMCGRVELSCARGLMYSRGEREEE
jgi:hypothetical protein